VAEEGEKQGKWSGRLLKPWQGRFVAALLIAAGALHAFKPAWLTLDWPSIALILVGVLLLFVPLEDVGAVVESLEFGKTKILFRKVKQLDDSVEQAIREEVAPANLNRILGKEELVEQFPPPNEGTATTPPLRRPPDALGRTPDTGKTASTDFLDDRRMRFLLDTDKEMALIRIGIEIERILADLERRAGLPTPSQAIVWSRTMRNLQQSGLITPQISKALTEFRNVRNQLIHPSGGEVPEALVTSAVDSGIKLLRLLSSIREMNEDIPGDFERARSGDEVPT
jgi:hypothetical protein